MDSHKVIKIQYNPNFTFCGDHLRLAKDVGNCKIQETLYLWAFGQDGTKSVENSRKHKIWKHEISVLL